MGSITTEANASIAEDRYYGVVADDSQLTKFATKEDAKIVIKWFDEKPELFVIKN